jgi:hypothetical protein
VIIVILGNTETNQLQMTYEGAEPAMVLNAMRSTVQMLEQQQAQQGNGQRPSGLIVPPTVVPRNIKGDMKDES